MLPSERINQIAKERAGQHKYYKISINDIMEFLDEYEQQQVDKFIAIEKELKKLS